MNPYNKDTFCTKCGGTEINSVYHEKSDGSSFLSDACSWVKPEHILRYCTNCHWEWLEKPLNLKPDLTKLRKVWEEFIQNTDVTSKNEITFQDGGKLIFNVLQAVKGLLEGNK